MIYIISNKPSIISNKPSIISNRRLERWIFLFSESFFLNPFSLFLQKSKNQNPFFDFSENSLKTKFPPSDLKMCSKMIYNEYIILIPIIVSNIKNNYIITTLKLLKCYIFLPKCY